MENHLTKDKNETRTTRKRDLIHQEILKVASKLIAEKGSNAVSLDEISKVADVARKTVYNHFDNKEALIHELVVPICDHARNYLCGFDGTATWTLNHLWNYCLELWSNESLHASVLYQIADEDYSLLKESKIGFLYVFSTILQRTEEFKKCDEQQIQNIAEIIYNVYVQVLSSIQDEPEFEHKFKKSMTGLVTGLI